ncbi:hypothetical protein AAC387_Pa02g0294 [Persea americana]
MMKTSPLSLSTPITHPITHISKAAFLHLIPFQFAFLPLNTPSQTQTLGKKVTLLPSSKILTFSAKATTHPQAFMIWTSLILGSIEPDPEMYN